MSTGGYLSAATAGSWRRGCGRPAWTKSQLVPQNFLRQLAGMGNNLNQIARRVNAGVGTGHDRVQIVAALMAIDAGLERLRHAVLEKGTDDDR